mmetsp:Transcript_14013/g.34543  ORF Transcript_14013/g.34543 Transcript_14013/m.34543 type:complete len:236 (+) Transcript_14013:763-1470(+)
MVMPAAIRAATRPGVAQMARGGHRLTRSLAVTTPGPNSTPALAVAGPMCSTTCSGRIPAPCCDAAAAASTRPCATCSSATAAPGSRAMSGSAGKATATNSLSVASTKIKPTDSAIWLNVELRWCSPVRAMGTLATRSPDAAQLPRMLTGKCRCTGCAAGGACMSDPGTAAAAGAEVVGGATMAGDGEAPLGSAPSEPGAGCCGGRAAARSAAEPLPRMCSRMRASSSARRNGLVT